MISARIRKSFAPGAESAGFSLDLEFESAARTTVLFGSSGSGKTLTLDSIAGFVRPDYGRIHLDGTVLFDSAAGVCLTPQQRRCGYVFQNYALFPHMTLRENLEFAAERLPKAGRARRVEEMIARFRLGDVAGRRPHEVSGGQKQRCSIARALIGAPRILLLDEPGRGLDAPLRVEFYEILRQVGEEFGTPIVLVTHDLDECLELGDRMLVVRHGRLVQSGAPREVTDRPASVEVARLLGLYNLLEAEVRAVDAARRESLLVFRGVELRGPFLDGRRPGDCVTLCIRPDELRAVASDGSARQVPLELLRAVPLPGGMRLEFSGDIAVETALAACEGSERHWAVEFPNVLPRVL